MSNTQNRNNKLRTRATVLIIIIILSMINSITPIFNQASNSAHADSLSPKDSLLLKSIKKGFRDCINSGILKKESIDLSSDYKDFNVFLLSSSGYTKDGTVKLPYNYGTGNTLADGDLSCSQLFNGFGKSGYNSFTTFQDLGGKNKPPYLSKDQNEKNAFLEALGYVPTSGSSTNMYCGALLYSVSVSHGSQSRSTNSICINVDSSGNIASAYGNVITIKDVAVDNTVDDPYIKLKYNQDTGRIVLYMTPAGQANPGDICNFDAETTLATSDGVDDKKGSSASAFFDKFFSNIQSGGKMVNPKPEGTFIGEGTTCYGDDLAKILNAERVAASAINSKSSKKSSSTGTELNKSLIKSYTYSGTPDYDKLLKYYVPSYSIPSSGPAVGSLDYELYGGSTKATSTTSSGFTAVERAYNWYYLLKDVFKGLSIDESIGCNTSKPQSGSYLQYLKQSESDPSKTEVQYCPIDEAILDASSANKVMSGGAAGVAYGAAAMHDEITLLSARDALNNLNSISLPSVCAADSSFPLCLATPLDCKSDPNKDGCKDLAGDNATEEEDGPNGETAFCMKNAGAFGWIICPLLTALRDASAGLFEKFVEPLLRVHESIIERLAINSSESPMYKAWALFRDMGNIVFVIVLLFVIFSQVTGFGIDNYGIKKVLPKLITTAIIVNFSYIICGIFVDLSNLVGDSIRNIFESIDVPNPTLSGSASASGIGIVWWISTLLSFIGLGVAGYTIAGAVFGGGIGATLLTIIVPILTFLGMAALAGFMAMLMLGVRQALVIIMIVISPIAFVLYAIPNTNPFFKKWSQLFRGLLVLYPVFCFMAGGGMLASKIIVATSSEFYLQLVGSLICIAPYFAVPSMTKNALKGFDSAINGLARIQSYGTRGVQAVNKTATNSRTYKNAVSDIESGRTARANEKIANRFMKKSPEEIARMPVGRRNRILGAISNATKDTQQSASIGAIASQYRNAISDEGKERTRISSMNAEDENQVKSYLSGYIDKNMSYDDALKNLIDLQNEGYGENEEENHQRDLQMRAYQRHILSTKDGQKVYERYLQKGRYEDDDGNIIKSGSTSERSRAVLARDYMSNNSDLKDKYGITYQQMQGMQGSGSIAQLKTSTAGPAALQSSRNQATNKFIDTMDSKDIRELSKNDAAEIGDARVKGSISAKANDKLETIAQGAVRSLENDPTQIGELNDNTRKLITNASGTNIDNLGNRVMEVRDNNGQLIQTMRWAKNGPANGGGNGGGNGGNGNGGGNGGNGNGGPTP